MALMFALIGFPLITAVLLQIVRDPRAAGWIVRVASVLVIIGSIALVVVNFGHTLTVSLPGAREGISFFVIAAGALLAVYIFILSVRHKMWLLSVFAVVQFVLGIVFDTKEVLYNADHGAQAPSMQMDSLSALMVLIIGVIGSLICMYAVGYMKKYQEHHAEVRDRRPFFMSILFVFLAAMFGLVLCDDVTWMSFCWEITSFCSFLLIGYTKTPEATRNAFRALTMNVAGGLALTVGAIMLNLSGEHDLTITNMVTAHPGGVMLAAVFLFAFAGLTKTAQMPFSSWLLGAMVAPTPTSALLHSSTMVKAGVYLIIRLAPALCGSAAGISVSLIGGFSFIITALLAISQSDAKKVLAYSTVSNLGLIITCASIGTPEAIWAAMMLTVFHAAAKSLMFLSVGSTELRLGSRNIEDMDGLTGVSMPLAFCMITGIAGMFLAPFGMLISKWAAMKALIDNNNVLLLLVVAFGSSATLFFWAKWLGKLVTHPREHGKKFSVTLDEKIPLYVQVALTVLSCVCFPLLSSAFINPFLTRSLGMQPAEPLSALSTTLLIAMMILLFILPLLLYPIYKKYSIRMASVYLSGENAGDNETFRGSMGHHRRVELRNWYMDGYFGEAKLYRASVIIGYALLILGLAATIIVGSL